jgi:arsenate reductase-like glutaredoxin family protein
LPAEQGTPEAPRCGFSRKVVEVLERASIPFGSFDILSDDEVRQGLKDFSQWPTYPQVALRGKTARRLDLDLTLVRRLCRPVADPDHTLIRPSFKPSFSPSVAPHLDLISPSLAPH